MARSRLVGGGGAPRAICLYCSVVRCCLVRDGGGTALSSTCSRPLAVGRRGEGRSLSSERREAGRAAAAGFCTSRARWDERRPGVGGRDLGTRTQIGLLRRPPRLGVGVGAGVGVHQVRARIGEGREPRTRMGMATATEPRSPMPRVEAQHPSSSSSSHPSASALPPSRRSISTTAAAAAASPATKPRSTPLLLSSIPNPNPNRRRPAILSSRSAGNARRIFGDLTHASSRRHAHNHAQAQAQEEQRIRHDKNTHDVKVKVTHLSDRGLVAVVGEDAVRFLGGVCTGTVPDPFSLDLEADADEGGVLVGREESTVQKTTAAAAAAAARGEEVGEATYDPATNAASNRNSTAPPSRVKNPRHSGFYTAFLNAQGRVLFDAFVYPASQSPGFWAGVPEAVIKRQVVGGRKTVGAVSGDSRAAAGAATRGASSGDRREGGNSSTPNDPKTQSQTPPTENQKKTPAFLLDVHASQTHDLAKHLRRYKLRAKVDVWPVEKESGWSVFALWGAGYSSSASDAAAAAAAVKDLSDLDKIFTPTTIGTPHDPRHPSLGARLVVPPSSPPPPPPPPPHISSSPPTPTPNHPTPPPIQPTTPLKPYTSHRQALSIPQGPHEIPPTTALPHEHNLDLLPGGTIDFRKGCYIGQELVIRTQHTGVVRKRVLGVGLYFRGGEGEGGAGGREEEGEGRGGEEGKRKRERDIKPGDLVKTVERWIRIDGEEPDIVPFVPTTEGGGEGGGGTRKRARPAGRWVASSASSSSISSSPLIPEHPTTTTTSSSSNAAPLEKATTNEEGPPTPSSSSEIDEDTGLALIRLEKMTDLLSLAKNDTGSSSGTDTGSGVVEGASFKEGDEFMLRRRRRNASGPETGTETIPEREVREGNKERTEEGRGEDEGLKEEDLKEDKDWIQEGEILVRAVVPAWIREALRAKGRGARGVGR